MTGRFDTDTRLSSIPGNTARQKRVRWTRLRTEAMGAGAALVAAAAALAIVAASQRAWVLFLDGDSLLFALVHASLAVGQEQRWTLTSPLFLPEAAVYLPISLLNAPVRPTLIIDGLVNWLAFYGVLRAVASTVRLRRSIAVGCSVGAMTALAFASTMETSSSRNALEPASLLDTTTYYAGTVIGTVGLVALAINALRHKRGSAALLGSGALTAFSVLSNPLFIAWAVLPLCALLPLAMMAGAGGRRTIALGCCLLGSTGLGLWARTPFHDILVQNNVAKLRPDLAALSLQYYGHLLADRLKAPPGWIELLLTVALMTFGVRAAVVSVRMRSIAGTLIAGVAVVGPTAAVIGSIALGTFAARYLQPAVFLPPLVLLLIPHMTTRGLVRRRHSGALPVVALGCVVGVVAPTSLALVRESTATDASVECVSQWIAQNPGRTGIGEYWTIRAPKAYSSDPRSLIQVDSAAHGYDWLINPEDLRRRFYSFTITDPGEDPPLASPFRPERQIECGRYTISDFGPVQIPIGRAHH